MDQKKLFNMFFVLTTLETRRTTRETLVPGLINFEPCNKDLVV